MDFHYFSEKRHKNAINSISNMARFISAVKNRDQSNETRQKKMEIESRMRVAKNLRKRTSTSLRSKCTDTTVQKLKSKSVQLHLLIIFSFFTLVCFGAVPVQLS